MLDVAEDKVNLFKRASLGLGVEGEDDGANSVCDDEENLKSQRISGNQITLDSCDYSHNISIQSWRGQSESIESKTWATGQHRYTHSWRRKEQLTMTNEME